MTTSTLTTKIALIGAGPANLTLSNILQNNSIPFTLYESSSTFRTSGGSLDLHPQTGQLALKEAGLWPQFVQHARPESDVLKLLNIHGDVLWDENTLNVQESKTLAQGDDKFAGRPEIDRKQLMQLLYENLEAGAVRFGKKLCEVVPNDTTSFGISSPKYSLIFADGSTESDFDIVIGGDGAWSKVRSLLSPTAQPEYSGITSVELWCNDVQSNHWLRDYVGEGSCFAFGDGCAVQAQRQGDGSLRTYASLRVPEDFLETCGIDWQDTHAALKEYVERFFSHVGVDLKRVVLESRDQLTPRKLYELPVGFNWPHRAGVTLIGDAAHVFTPFAGVGVNVGMTDALVLGKEMVAAWKGEKSFGQAIQAYEQEMFPRAKIFAEKTMKGKINHFSEHGAQEFVDRMKAHYETMK